MWTTLWKWLTGHQETTMNNDVRDARSIVAELEAEYDAITARVMAGEASLADYGRRGPCLSELTAAREASAALESRQQRAAQAERGADLVARLDATLLEIGECVPRLQLACIDLKRLVGECYSGGLPPDAPANLDELLGLRADFADVLLRALSEAAQGSDFYYAAPGERPQRPKLHRDNRVVQVGRAELPPGASGIVNSLTGQVTVGAPTE
jgi:hypothetical protein